MGCSELLDLNYLPKLRSKICLIVDQNVSDNLDFTQELCGCWPAINLNPHNLIYMAKPKSSFLIIPPDINSWIVCQATSNAARNNSLRKNNNNNKWWKRQKTEAREQQQPEETKTLCHQELLVVLLSLLDKHHPPNDYYDDKQFSLLWSCRTTCKTRVTLSANKMTKSQADK